ALPLDDPQHVLRVRAFACYLSAMMLAASAALVSIAASNLQARIAHRWQREIDPVGADNDPSRLKIARSGRQLRRRFVPTLFLRVLVTAGLKGGEQIVVQG
ncbi:MAG TPA: hypothetical protein PLV68_06095, partial [Ilumatobacteraceae bacterium]|nr:hypothetical protein [Ilumatobacteraceae bacterium]